MSDLIEREEVQKNLENLFKGYISDGLREVDTVDASALVQAVVRDTPSAEGRVIANINFDEDKLKEICDKAVKQIKEDNDLEKVTRCKDCKHFHQYTEVAGDCDIWKDETKRGDFCIHGEKMDEGARK